MARRKTKAYSPETYRKVQGFRLFDDTFMSKVFDGRKKETALLLQIILEDPSIKVTSVHAQVEVKNLQGRGIRFDIKAKNSAGKTFVVEVQRDSRFAKPKRARHTSGMIDANALGTKQKVGSLPETYVIFITEKDVLGLGLPIYHIDRTIKETGTSFDDMAHIIYVNGAYTDDSELGKLMQDFHKTQADEMNYKLLADRVRYFKETEEGQDIMCATVEKYAKEQVTKANKTAIINGFRVGVFTKDNVTLVYPKLKAADIDALYEEAQKLIKGRKAARA